MPRKKVRSELLKEESAWVDLALSSRFETGALFVICLNAVWIGVHTDMNAGKPSPANPFDSGSFGVEIFFCVAFSVEI